MARRTVGEALRGAQRALRPRAGFVPASRLAGSELIHLGGGEMLPTPRVPDLPTSQADRDRGLCGASLALPAAKVRVLKDVQICVGENLIRTRSGAVVLDNISSEQLAGLPRRNSGGSVLIRGGSAALYGPRGAGTFAWITDALPAALLLQHPALGAQAPIALLRAGSTGLVEGLLIERLEHRQLRLETVPAGSVISAERTIVPAQVTREGGGALPRWYRRWLDQQAASVTELPVDARRLLLTHGQDDPILRHADLLANAKGLGFARLDTVTGAIADDETLDAASIVATLREATHVLGGSDNALAHAALCRRAEILHVGLRPTVRPRVAQLAASRALPYRFIRPGALTGIDIDPDGGDSRPAADAIDSP